MIVYAFVSLSSVLLQVEMDPELVRELRDLNVTLAEVQRQGSASDTSTPAQPDPWEALLLSTLSKRRLKLVMYESNV